MEPEQVETLVKQVTAPAPGDRRKPPLRRLPATAWRYAFRRAVHNYMVDLDNDVAGTLTYCAVLSMFPALLALLTLLSLVGEQQATARWLMDFVGRYLNSDLVAVLRDPITRLTQAQHAGWILVVSLALALWGANGYVSAFGRAMNRVFEVAEGRPLWKIIPYNLMLTAGTLVVGGLTLLAMVFSTNVVLALSSMLSRSEAAGPAQTAAALLEKWDAARWPILMVTAVVYTTALFHLTPNVRQGRFRWVTPGSVLAICGMVLAVLGFNLYVDRFATYNETYGAVGSFIVLLVALWMMNCALLFGGELDAELERARELRAGIEAERTLQLPPRDVRMIRAVVAAQEQFVSEGRALRESAESQPTSPGRARRRQRTSSPKPRGPAGPTSVDA